MTISKQYNSDMMIDANRDEPTFERYVATIPIRMTVNIQSEEELSFDEIIEKVEEVISNLCEEVYKHKSLSEITNIMVDTDSKWDVVVG